MSLDMTPPLTSSPELRGRQLTRKQREVLTAIQRFSALRGYMPSVRELGRELGGLAPATVQHHLSTLRRKGYLDHDGSAHGVRLAGMSSPIATAPLAFEKGEPLPSRPPADDGFDMTSAMQVVVPLLGSIAAGKPLEALEETDEYVPIPASLAKRAAFALRVTGSSMIEDGIFDGDIIVVQPGERVENGQVAVVLLHDDTATLKRVYLDRDGVRLQPANSTMQPMVVPSVRVRGRVTGLIRRYD